MAIDVQAEYDDGYFDKDEQGWCARCVKVTSDGPWVTIRRHGDDNGLRAYDETVVGWRGPEWPELGLVQIAGDRGPIAYFDANTGRLRVPAEQMPHWFSGAKLPPAPDDFAAALAMIVPVAAALGMQPGPPPTEIVMPPLTPSPTAGDSRESNLSIPGRNGDRWVFMRREYPEGDPMGPQFEARVEGEGCWVSVFVGDHRRAMFLFMGPLERYHLAIAARDAAIAKWCE